MTDLPADAETIGYAMRCAANWINERSPEAIDGNDVRGVILRWNRDHPDIDDDK